MIKFINLLIGGALGTLARYTLSGAIYKILGTNFPHGTLAVNILGCFFLGFLVAISEDKFLLNANLRLFLMIGFCGAFTTFSTFMLESSSLLRDGQTLKAFLNVFLTISLGFILLKIGILLGEII